MICFCRLGDQLQTVWPLSSEHGRSPTSDRLIMLEYDKIVQDLENHVHESWENFSRGLCGNDVFNLWRLRFFHWNFIFQALFKFIVEKEQKKSVFRLQPTKKHVLYWRHFTSHVWPSKRSANFCHGWLPIDFESWWNPRSFETIANISWPASLQIFCFSDCFRCSRLGLM